MSRPSFFNDNLYRSYPLVPDPTTPVPTYAVVDFGCTFFPGAGFNPETDSVYLAELRKISSFIEFEFQTTATALANKSLIFRFNTTDPEFTTGLADISVEHIGATSVYTIEPLAQDCDIEPVWSGYMTIGDVAQLTAQITTAISGTFTVEPSRVQSQQQAYVRSLTLYNADRTRATTTTDCKAICWPFTVADYYLVASCLSGNVSFKEGYNCEIRQDAAINTISINAYVGAGEGEVCETPAVTSDEEAPVNRTTLDGALKCSEVVRSINGAGGRQFTIRGMEGVTITPVPTEHKLVVNVDMVDLQLCTDFRPEGDTLSSSYGIDPCDCGPA